MFFNFNYFFDNHLLGYYFWDFYNSLYNLLNQIRDLNNFLYKGLYRNNFIMININIFDYFYRNMNNFFKLNYLWDLNYFLYYFLYLNNLWNFNYSLNNLLYYFFNFNNLWNHSKYLKNIININDI